MQTASNPIVETYSRLASQYDDQSNDRSCWGKATQKAIATIRLKAECRDVLDMGCGTGKALVHLASASPCRRFIGVDPAENMRVRARERVGGLPNAEIRGGCFESIPVDTHTVDYLYSILAFHWTTDLEASIREISRVLRTGAEADLFFIGRDNGREFILKTTPIFLKYMGPALLLNSARMRKQLTREATFQLFSKTFGSSRVAVEESYDTYYDTLEGHWGWWVRIEGHFVQIPPDQKQACDSEVRQALLSLSEPQGIPYTIHLLHVHIGPA